MKQAKGQKGWASFWETMRPMTWSQRIEHFFSYYTEYAFVICVAAVLIGVILWGITGERSQVIFGGAFANVDINRYGYDYLTAGVQELLDADPEKQKAELTSTAFAPVEELSQLDYAFNAAMAPIAKLEEGALDYLVMDETAMEFYMTQYALMDLREVFTQEELEAFGADLIWLELQKEATKYPVAIRVNGIPFFEDCVEVRDPVYFSFTGPEEKAEQYRIFWDYLLNWKNAGQPAS